MRNTSHNDLNNRKTWTQKDGTVLRVKDLTPLHRANIIRMLEREASARHTAAVDELEAMRQRVLSDDEGGIVTGLVHAILKELNSTYPIAELRRTPLMRKLHKLEAKAVGESEMLAGARTRIEPNGD